MIFYSGKSKVMLNQKQIFIDLAQAFWTELLKRINRTQSFGMVHTFLAYETFMTMKSRQNYMH